MFKPVSTKVSFPELEEQTLRFWKERDVFRRTEREREGAPLFVLYEGPPTANAKPGIHHVLARVFKDIIPRYKTMQGFRCLRKGGWDTHGLPVELEVEKELGISSKQEIERHGVEAFNQRCKESVMRYVKTWEELTDRIAFWVDMDHAYVTFTNDYIESCWWILKQLWDRRLLYEGMKGVPHCPRCVTTLSSHEVALGYQENVPDPSVYVKFPIAEGQPVPWEKSDVPTVFLAWTTTPWTLPGNTALAVAPDQPYVVVEVEGKAGMERLVLAQALVGKIIKEEHRVLATVEGRNLVGMTYRTPYDAAAAGVEVFRFRHERVGDAELSRLHKVSRFTPRVIAADFVALDEGTGIVHIAPAFGDEDLNAGRQQELAFVQPVDLQGNVTGSFPFAGKFVKKADEDIMKDLASRGLLYQRGTYRHTYPFCWRCGTPLLYYAKNSWYIMTTAVKELLISGNQEINWYPEHIKKGRFGEWLRNNVDWAISRERYWGTPVPIWRCQGCGAEDCIGSAAELKERALPEHLSLIDPDRLDLHRPYVDRIALRCQKCQGEMRRIPEVMDCWFDSGAMSFAQWHYPFENKTLFQDGRFPADYICEAVDQTRGWFYSLHALSTLIANGPCFRNVICLGLILDEKGEKMSKSKGNVAEPWTVLKQEGADALRWYLYTSAPPGNARRFSSRLVQESLRQFLLTLWNTYVFFVTYANLDRWDPRSHKAARPTAELDRWILSELHILVGQVTQHLEEYNPTDAARRIQEFVEGLSNWYVRRSRRRFWKSEEDADKQAAYSTLYTCLTTLSKLLAPFTPFVAEEMHQNLVRSASPDAPESVHLARWPEADAARIDEPLSRAVRLAMRISSLGRAARSKAAIRVRQPLAQVLVRTRSPDERDALLSVQPQIVDELNVKELRILEGPEEIKNFLAVRPNMALLGPRLRDQVSRFIRAFESADPLEIYGAAASGQKVTVGEFTLEPGEVEVLSRDVAGYAVSMEGGYLVAVSTQVTEELAEEGLARELVHRIQNMRKSAGLEIADRIETFYQGDQRLHRVMERYADYIQQETLSVALREGEPGTGAYTERQNVDGLEVALGVKRVE